MQDKDDIQVVFENKDILILNKPSGVLMHATHKNEKDTLADWVFDNFPECRSVGDEGRGGIVHRLDRATSGLVIVARNLEIYTSLKELFLHRGINKKYYALVWGVPKEEKGVIEKGITSYKGKRRTVELWSQKTPNKVRDATTEWEIVDSNKEFALLDVKPKTGRMHQIRVHLASIGHPIVCDNLYSGKKTCPLELGRLFLHAYSLSVPYKDSNIEVDIPISDELSDFLENIQIKI